MLRPLIVIPIGEVIDEVFTVGEYSGAIIEEAESLIKERSEDKELVRSLKHILKNAEKLDKDLLDKIADMCQSKPMKRRFYTS